MMRDMTEGSGQQPPQDPRPGAADGGREVLEGRVIPSRPQPPYAARAPQPQAPHPRQAGYGDDPRQQFGQQPSPGPSGPQGGGPQSSGQQGAQGPSWTPQGSQGSPGAAPGPAAPTGPSAGPGAAQGAPQGAPGMGSHRTPFPRQQGPAGGPPGGVPDSPGTPDWGAIADQQAASGARRRRMLMLTGGIVAVAVIAGGVATAVVMSGKSSDKPVAGPSSSTTASQQPLPPTPSFSSVAPPPPANPLDYLSTAAKDKAPVTPGSLFPGKQFLMSGRVYVKTGTAQTTQCASGAHGALAAALSANGCRKLIRATYTEGTVAVTVGIAVFDDKAHAAKLQKVAQYLGPLPGGGVNDFCHAVACRMTSNAVGRYAYFAISGLKNGKTITASDVVAKNAVNDASNFAFQRIIQRGRDAAAADPKR